MQYELEIQGKVERKVDRILYYLENNKKNHQAVVNFLDEYEECLKDIVDSPESYAFCTDDRLRNLGYKHKHFSTMRYKLIYRIESNTVLIEGIYHDLEDYENAL